MTRKRRGLWIFLFVVIALLLGSLATGWNVVLLTQYRQALKLAPSLSPELRAALQAPWTGVVLGTLGFIAALATVFALFARLLREMKLNQLQSEFLASVSHELKTPIAAIELSGSLLRAGNLTESEIASLWDSHSKELARLRRDVEELLEAARWETEPLRAARVPIQLESWLETSFNRWKSRLGPGALLRREGETLDSVTWLEPRALELITDNLIENSRKFARGVPEVTIKTRRLRKLPWKSARWQIRIEDRGWGFEASQARKIFQRFYRAKTDAPQAVPGTGLGLYLAASASKGLGLKLYAESAGRGRGAAFTIEGKEGEARA